MKLVTFETSRLWRAWLSKSYLRNTYLHLFTMVIAEFKKGLGYGERELAQLHGDLGLFAGCLQERGRTATSNVLLPASLHLRLTCARNYITAEFIRLTLQHLPLDPTSLITFACCLHLEPFHSSYYFASHLSTLIHLFSPSFLQGRTLCLVIKTKRWYLSCLKLLSPEKSTNIHNTHRNHHKWCRSQKVGREC